MKVIMLGAGGTGVSFAIISRIRATWGSQVKIILTDIYDEHLVAASILSDSFYKVPRACDPFFRKVISEIILKEKVKVYIPILNDEIIAASYLQKDSAFGDVDFWVSEKYVSCLDKEFARSWLSDLGIRVPETVSEEKLKAKDKLWFSKPRDGFGSKGTRIISSQQVIELSHEERSQVIIQELCDGPEVTVDSFWDSGKAIGYAYCRERLEVKSGVCTKAKLFFDSELAYFAKVIGEALGQRGTICFQVMKNSSGWVVTDLNLRPGAGTAMTCSAGFDVLSAAFACRVGEDYTQYVKELKVKEEFYIVRQYSEFVTQRPAHENIF